MDVKLAQRGRALMDFEVSARQTANRLQRDLEAELAAKGITAETLPDDMDERHRVIDAALVDSDLYRTRGLLGDYCWTYHGVSAEEAFEEIKDQVTDQLALTEKGPTTIDYREGFQAPDYWAKSWFHRTHGGWDGNPYHGYIHGEIVHKKYVSKVYPGDVYGARRQVARLAPRTDYKKILEIGTSSGHYTVALSEVFPDAEIWGIDPSPRMLEQAQRVGNELGKKWNLVVGVGEDTGFEDESFDMVTSYAIHHEIPPRIVDAFFKEAYRILKPGGTVLMADVTRYSDIDKLASWRFDWVAKYGGEPFWRATASMDFAPHCEAAGFVDVKTGCFEPLKVPYYVVGVKPE